MENELHDKVFLDRFNKKKKKEEPQNYYQLSSFYIGRNTVMDNCASLVHLEEQSYCIILMVQLAQHPVSDSGQCQML